MRISEPRIVRFPNTEEGVKNYLLALSLIMTMPTGFNRPVRKSHAKLMAQSVKEFGITRTIIAINTACFNGESNTYSGDGQHLRYALLNYIKPSEIKGILSIAYYDIDDRKEIIPFISRLNSTAKSWNVKEFLLSWVSHGLEQYKYILDIHNKTKHSISKLIEIFTFKRDNVSAQAFRNGELKINKALGHYVLNTYNNACAVGLYKSNSSFLAFTRIMVDYRILDPNEMLNMIVDHSDVFGQKLKRDEYLIWFRNYLTPPPSSNKKAKKEQKVLV